MSPLAQKLAACIKPKPPAGDWIPGWAIRVAALLACAAFWVWVARP